MTFCRICSKAPFLNPPHFPVAWPHWRQVSYGPDVITFEYNTAENIWLKEGNLGIEHHTSFEALFVGAESCEMCHFIQLSASRVIEACTDENASSHITKYIGRPTGPLWIYHRVRLDLESPLASVYFGRPVPVDPPGSAVYERLHYWLHNCVHNHEHKEIQEGTRHRVFLMCSVTISKRIRSDLWTFWKMR
jgi:hypothetical protein